MRFASLLAVLLAASVVSGSQYFLNAYTSPLPNGCQVATLADFQSAEFAAQYNVNGYLPVSSAIPQSTDCGIDVLTTVGGTPGRLQANEGAGFVVTFTPGTGPYEGCGTTPYTMTISLGTSLDDGNLLWTTITPAIQGNATVGTFFSPGSVALLKCDTSSYYLNAYASIPNECRLATFAEFQSAEFMNQYNAVGYLNVYESIPESTDCGVNVMGTSGAGRLQLNNGSYDYVLTYPPHSGPYEGCGTGPYTAQIALGTQMANVAWNSLTAAIVSSVDVGDIGTNSVAIVKCGGATPSPPVMTTYLLSQYSNGIPMGCEIATLNDFRSATFAAQYNYNGSLGVYGTIDSTTDCGINVVDVRGGAPGRLLYNKSGSFDFVTVYQPGEDDQLCDGPYGSALSLGMTGDAGVYYSITPALQESAAVGSFYNPGSIALIKCS